MKTLNKKEFQKSLKLKKKLNLLQQKGTDELHHILEELEEDALQNGQLEGLVETADDARSLWRSEKSGNLRPTQLQTFNARKLVLVVDVEDRGGQLFGALSFIIPELDLANPLLISSRGNVRGGVLTVQLPQVVHRQRLSVAVDGQRGEPPEGELREEGGSQLRGLLLWSFGSD